MEKSSREGEEGASLLTAEVTEEGWLPRTLNKQTKKTGILEGQNLHLLALYTAIACLVTALAASLAQKKTHDPTLDIYSPANHLVEYEDVNFYDNVEHFSPYQVWPPNDHIDRLWQELYGWALYTRVDAAAAKRLVNRTVVIPDTGGDALVTIEVFHMLHCLDSLRKAFFPARYPEMSPFFANGTRNNHMTDHSMHCLDHLRQNIMCASDLGTNYFRMRSGTPLHPEPHWWPAMGTVHKCRKFETIRSWAEERDVPNFNVSAPSKLTP